MPWFPALQKEQWRLTRPLQRCRMEQSEA